MTSRRMSSRHTSKGDNNNKLTSLLLLSGLGTILQAIMQKIRWCCPVFTLSATTQQPEAVTATTTKVIPTATKPSDKLGKSSSSDDATSEGLTPPSLLPALTREKSFALAPQRSTGGSSGIWSNFVGTSMSESRNAHAHSSPSSSPRSASGVPSREEDLQVGDTSRPPSSLVEASSRRLANFQSRKEADKKETQRGVVKRFMNATAKAFAEENPMYVNDPSVSGLLHDDIILITYDKMKFFGKKIVQKKINSGMEQMMFMTAQMRQQYRIQTESGEMVAGGFDQEALAGPRDRETVPGAENAIPEADKTSSPGGGFEATGKNAHPITSSKSPVVAHEASEAASFDVVGPDPVEGKDGVWLVEYTWKYGKASVAFVETFTIEDYKIKKLKRSRG